MAKRDIYARLDALEPAAWDGLAFRHSSLRYDTARVLNGDGARQAGGRWNPEESFRTVYLSEEPETVFEEFLRSIGPGRDPRALAKTRVLWQARVRADNLVDLRTVANRRLVGLPARFDYEVPRELCQEIGEAAYYVRYKGILAPSAAREGAINIIVFPDYLEDRDVFEVVTEEHRRFLSEFFPPQTE